MSNLQRIGVFKIKRIQTIKDFPENTHDEIRNGGKVILPETTLHKFNTNVPSPFIIKITLKKKSVFCGVISFSGDSGHVFVPEWMMKQLEVASGTCVTLFACLKAAPKGEKAIFQPQSTDFFEITDPKAVLERSLRNFTCLTKNDKLDLRYNNKTITMLVTETVPDCTVNIVDCDLLVDFKEPVGYKAQKRTKKQDTAVQPASPPQVLTSAIACRADGKPLTDGQQEELISTMAKEERQRFLHQPDFDYQIGTLTFKRTESRM